MRLFVGSALMLAFAACAATPPASTSTPASDSTTPATPAPSRACDAAPAQWALGKPATADTIERVRVDSHSRVVRMLRPGMMVTMEFNAERVDIRVDGNKVILAVTCG
jgi:hypothetical protein